jgi:hypothetical protein
MMRLMQSMVPTQEHCGPVSVVHVELGADHQDRWRLGVENVFPGRSQFYVAINESIYILVLA